MGAPIDNKNAVKWTLDSAKEFESKVLDYVKNNEDCVSLADAFSSLGSYESQFTYLKERFKEFEFASIKESKEIIKARIMKQGMYNKANATMAIFILKNNHDMADKVETKNDTTIQVPTINITKPE